jgi:hypothetical protein
MSRSALLKAIVLSAILGYANPAAAESRSTSPMR